MIPAQCSKICSSLSTQITIQIELYKLNKSCGKRNMLNILKNNMENIKFLIIKTFVLLVEMDYENLLTVFLLTPQVDYAQWPAWMMLRREKVKISVLNGSQLAKNEKYVFLTCPYHNIYRLEALGFFSSYTFKKYDFILFVCLFVCLFVFCFVFLFFVCFCLFVFWFVCLFLLNMWNLGQFGENLIF